MLVQIKIFVKLFSNKIFDLRLYILDNKEKKKMWNHYFHSIIVWEVKSQNEHADAILASCIA